MNRKRLAILAFALGVAAAPFVTVIVNWSATAGLRQLAAQEDDIEVPANHNDQPTNQDLIVIQPVDTNADAHEAYLNLVRQKLSLLSSEQLAEETQILEREVLELEASRKLREAQRLLEQLIEQHPQSAAAQRARLMLQQHHGASPRQHRAVPIDTDETLRSEEVVRPRGRSANSFEQEAPLTPSRRHENRRAIETEDDQR